MKNQPGDLSADSTTGEIPSRSTLFNLVPYGLGTWKVESLRSFIGRLANAHTITMTRLKQIVIGEISRPRQDPDEPLQQRQIDWNGLGGLGRLTRAWVQGLERQLGSAKAAETTLSSLQNRVAGYELFTTNERVCPACVQNMEATGTVYGMLIWSVAAVKACPTHGIPLELKRGTIRYKRARWRLWEEFSSEQPEPLQSGPAIEGQDLEVATARAKLVAGLIGSQEFRQGFPEGPGRDVAEFIKGTTRHFFEGNQAALARYIGVNKGAVSSWSSRSYLPGFTQVLDLAQAFDCSVVAVLSGDCTELPMILPEQTSTSPRKKYRSIKVKSVAFRMRLEKELSRREYRFNPPSLSQLARNLEVDETQVRRAYPEIAKRVSDEFQSRRHWSATVSQTIRHQAYRTAAEALAKAGELPTRNKVMYLLAGVSLFARKDKKECQAICAEVRKKWNLKSKRGRAGSR